MNWEKTYRIDSNKRRPGMSAVPFPPQRYRFVHLSRLMWLIRSGKGLRNNFLSRWLFLFLWLFNKIIQSKWKYVAKSIRWSFRGIQHLRSGIGLFETGLKPTWNRTFFTRIRVDGVLGHSEERFWNDAGFGFRWAGSLVSCGRRSIGVKKDMQSQKYPDSCERALKHGCFWLKAVALSPLPQPLVKKKKTQLMQLPKESLNK